MANFNYKCAAGLRNGMKVKDLRLSNNGNSLVGKFYNNFLGGWYHGYWSLSGKHAQQKEFDLVYIEQQDGYSVINKDEL